MHNSTNLVCAGIMACANTTIYNVNNIYFVASSASADVSSQIYLTDQNQRTINVYFGGYQSGSGITIHCDETWITSCNILCLTEDSCLDDNDRNEDATIVFCIYEYNCNITCYNNKCPIIVYRYLNNTQLITTTSSRSKITGMALISTILSTTSTSQESDDHVLRSDSKYDDIRSELESISLLLVVGSFFVESFLVIFVYMWHECVDVERKKGCDKPKYYVIVQCVNYIADFSTDIIFCIILFFENIDAYEKNDNFHVSNPLLLSSMFFLFCPFMMECVSCVYWIVKWKDSKSNRINAYLKKYEIFFYFFTVLTSFYNAVSLLRSKFFYKKFFYFSLKSNEYSKLQIFRFINVTICENIPQLIIQQLYISYFKNPSIVVYCSMIFSILSLIFSFLIHISNLCNKIHNSCKNSGSNSNSMQQSTVLNGFFSIKSQDLTSYHNFSHKQIEYVIDAYLHKCNKTKLILNRSNVSYIIEVYYIQDLLSAFNQLDIHFDITINVTSLNSNKNDIIESINNQLQQINSNHLFLDALTASLKLNNVTSITTAPINCTTTTRKNRYSNAVDVRTFSNVVQNPPKKHLYAQVNNVSRSSNVIVYAN